MTDNPEWLKEFEAEFGPSVKRLGVADNHAQHHYEGIKIGYLAAKRKDAEELTKVKRELAKWEEPFDQERFVAIKKQASHKDSLAAYSVYVTALEHALKHGNEQLTVAQLDLQRSRGMLQEMVSEFEGAEIHRLSRAANSWNKAAGFLATPIDTTALAQHDAEVLREAMDACLRLDKGEDGVPVGEADRRDERDEFEKDEGYAEDIRRDDSYQGYINPETQYIYQIWRDGYRAAIAQQKETGE